MPEVHREESGLDPADWEALRRLGHRIVDDVVKYHRTLGERPAWQPLTPASRDGIRRPLPREGVGEQAAYDAFVEHVLPFPYGNIHPRMWGWVNGAGTTFGAFAEMLGAAMNPNCWGGEHAGPYVEDAVLAWLREMVGLEHLESGLLVSGGSEANLIALAAARDARAGSDVTTEGLQASPAPLVMYCSTETHNSVAKSASLLGLGAAGLRVLPSDDAFRLDPDALAQAIRADRRAGRRPVCVIATAGNVNTGSLDPLDPIADLCERESLWLHVDGAFGALAALSPSLRPLVAGMERADSVAFDLHKWLQIPIEAAVVFVRRRADHQRPFSTPASYLTTLPRGIASGPHFYSDLGPQLTRGFRAAKVWLSLLAHGSERYARLVEQCVAQARQLGALVRRHPSLELLAPVALNVVCFRYRPRVARDANAMNQELLMQLQESGEAAPSGTVVSGHFGLRCAFVNHRTRMADLDRLVHATGRIGAQLDA